MAAPLTSERVQAWLDEYIAAWISYDRARIAALFSERPSYRYHPADEPIEGVEAIVESWFDEPDEAGSFDASYEPFAVEGDRAVAIGTSSYLDAAGEPRAIYDNCFLLRFDSDGRCAELVEWYVKRPGG